MQKNDEFLYALRNANPIETVMGSYVNLIRRGRNFVCSCPFHSEKTPSCTVFPDTQSFYCFGCGAGGDVITFTMKAENLDFLEAVRLLAERSGLQIPENNSRDDRYAKRRTRIYEMNRIAANYFYKNLISGNNKAGLQYFYNRKLTPQTIKKYGLGFASDSYYDLINVLHGKGYSDEEIIDAWLGAKSKTTDKVYDLFRNRVMFPIVDLRGNIIGFGGRVLDNSTPKYLNTGKTPVFDKGSNLFSMHFAKNADSKRLILCEGYMDVIAVNQAGFENVVATLGTAITPDQARLISHYCDEVVIAYDSDGAGQRATQKAINHFSEVGLRTRILRMEGAKDPDEYIKKFGSARFRMLIEGSDDANNFMLDRCEDGIDIDTEGGKVELLKRVSNVLAGIESPLEREVYISRTAKKCDISPDILKSHISEIIRIRKNTQKKNEWKTIQAKTAYVRDEINPEAVKFRREARAEETIIRTLMMRPEDADRIAEKAPPDIFITSFNKRVYTALLDAINNSEKFSLSLLASEFSPDEMGKISGMIAQENGFSVSESAVDDCAAALKKGSTAANLNDGDISDDQLREMFSSKKK